MQNPNFKNPVTAALLISGVLVVVVVVAINFFGKNKAPVYSDETILQDNGADMAVPLAEDSEIMFNTKDTAQGVSGASGAIADSPEKITEIGRAAEYETDINSAQVTPPAKSQSESAKEVQKIIEKEKSSVNRSALRKFAVQVGSFQNAQQAQSVVKALLDKGYPAYSVMRDIEGKGVWYRVWVGTYETKQEALSALDNMKTIYKESFIIANEK